MKNLTKQDIEKRQRAVKSAIANQKLEGLFPTPAMQERDLRWIHGKITTQEAINEVISRAKNEVSKRK